jgi:hypothetical protein
MHTLQTTQQQPSVPHNTGDGSVFGNYFNLNFQSIQMENKAPKDSDCDPSMHESPWSADPQAPFVYTNPQQKCNQGRLRRHQTLDDGGGAGHTTTYANFSPWNYAGDNTAIDLSMDRSAAGHGDFNINGSSDQLTNTCAIPSASSHINLTSLRTVPELLQQIKRTLDERGAGLAYQYSEKLFRLSNVDVQMELEVREGRGVNGVNGVNGLQVRRIAGDRRHYRQLCNELLAHIHL